MERLARRRLWFKIATVASLVTGGLGLVGTVVFSLLIMYLPLIVSIVLLGHTLYGTVFYYIGQSNAQACMRALAAIEGGVRKISELSPAMGRRETAAEALISSCIEKGIITGFTLSEGELFEAENEPVAEGNEENTENT